MATLKTNTYKSPTTGRQWSYLTAGPSDGPVMFFLHGWPGIASTWKHQLVAFGGLGFSVVAPDMPGYGGTWTSKDPSEFALEKLVPQFIELLHDALGRRDAIWIGHDWGCGPLWAIASHHPEVCRGIVALSVPYRTLEMGLPTLLTLIDRQVYPEDEYAYGQFSYQVFYERDPTVVDRQFETDLPRTIKLIYAKGHPDVGRAPSRLSLVAEQGGWFGGVDAPVPDVPLDRTVLDQEILDELVAGAEKNGWHGATAWYLNHAANEKYSREKSLDGGKLRMPVLFLHTEYDAVCQTVYNPKFAAEMREKVEDLSELVLKAGHWGALECPEDTNAGIAEWIVKRVRDSWPGPEVKSKM